jgi:hypothetical protein
MCALEQGESGALDAILRFRLCQRLIQNIPKRTIKVVARGEVFALPDGRLGPAFAEAPLG